MADNPAPPTTATTRKPSIRRTSLKGNEDYLRYLWIHNLESGNHDVIYVPTEAGLPILEAGKRQSGGTTEAENNLTPPPSISIP